MEENKVIIVIPIYKSELSSYESISLKQCLKILYRYPISIVTPLSKSIIENIVQGENISYQHVPTCWMNSISSYNKMMLNSSFYSMYEDYKYMLLYQLDAFVFCDELSEFCDMGFDYIGAPWISGQILHRHDGNCLWYVGNGGFSLRKISSFIHILEENRIKNIEFQEDIFWASCKSTEFHVPEIETALRFSIESNVKMCIQLNRGKLPFGCHAWEKYDFAFWIPYIRKEGYDIEMDIFGNYDEKNTFYPKLDLQQNLNCILDTKDTIKRGKILIWGAGNYGKELGWLLLNHEINQFEYVDSSPSKIGKRLLGKKINSIQILENNKKSKVVIVAIKYGVNEVLENLRLIGYKTDQIIIYPKDIMEYNQQQTYIN